MELGDKIGNLVLGDAERSLSIQSAYRILGYDLAVWYSPSSVPNPLNPPLFANRLGNASPYILDNCEKIREQAQNFQKKLEENNLH